MSLKTYFILCKPDCLGHCATLYGTVFLEYRFAIQQDYCIFLNCDIILPKKDLRLKFYAVRLRCETKYLPVVLITSIYRSLVHVVTHKLLPCNLTFKLLTKCSYTINLCTILHGNLDIYAFKVRIILQIYS